MKNRKNIHNEICTIKCKKCENIIFVQWSPLEINKKNNKTITEIDYNNNGYLNTIYLTCENNHTEKYFCKIETKKRRWKNLLY